MRMKLKQIITLLTIILVVVSQMAHPITVLGEALNGSKDESSLQLFQMSQDVELDENVTILEGTYFYGYKQEDEVQIQFADSEISIPYEVVQGVEIDESSPKYNENLEGLNKENNKIAQGTSLYSIAPDDQVRLTIQNDLEYPVYENELGLDITYIGNIEYYLQEEDRLLAIETAESSKEPTDDEVPVPDEEIEYPENEEQESEESVEDNMDNPVIEEEQEIKDETSESEQIVEGEDSTDEITAEQQAPEKSERVSVFSADLTAGLWDGVSSDYFKVTTDNLIVYDNRGSGPLKPVGTLEKNQVYPRVSDYGNWHRIQIGNIYGYVEKAETVPDNGSSIKNENNSYTNQSRTITIPEDVVVYDNTSGSLVPFGVIDKGQTYPISSDYGNWWRIIFSDRVGYVRKSEVETQFTTDDKYFRADGNIDIYDNRGSGSLMKVGELKKGQVYPRVNDYGNWHRIQFDDYYGYVRKSETSIYNGSGIKNLNKSYTNQSRKFTALNELTVYDNTSGSLVPFGVIDKNKTYSIAADYGNWWRVIFADRIGYVSKDEVKAQVYASDNFFRALSDNLPVYDNRGSGSLKKVGELRKGQAYPIVSNYGNWWRVQFGDIYGYVEKAKTGYATKSEIRNHNSNYKNSKDKIVAIENVVVYDNTSSGGLVPFGELESGTIFPIASDYGNWWRIIYLDRVGYVRKSEVDVAGVTYSRYGISIERAVQKQMNEAPQTDVYNGKVYVHWSAFESISLNTMKGVIKSNFNIRTGPSTNYHSLYFTKSKRNVTLASKEYVRDNQGAKWWEITRSSLPTWINAPYDDVLYHMNAANFVSDERQQFQFLDLSKNSSATASDLNKVLSHKGILQGKGSTFINAGITHNVNDIYLVSHALLETGNGTSELANGIKYNGVTVYNMFGIGAYDHCPEICGAEKAYEEGWTTPEKAIIGGAKFIGEGYVNAGQNTLYKMRWNPTRLVTGDPTHQYATDIGWASKQTRTIYDLYQQLDSYLLLLDIPDYNN